MSGERRVRKRGEVKSERSRRTVLEINWTYGIQLKAAMNTSCTDKQIPGITYLLFVLERFCQGQQKRCGVKMCKFVIKKDLVDAL